MFAEQGRFEVSNWGEFESSVRMGIGKYRQKLREQRLKCYRGEAFWLGVTAVSIVGFLATRAWVLGDLALIASVLNVAGERGFSRHFREEEDRLDTAMGILQRIELSLPGSYAVEEGVIVDRQDVTRWEEVVARSWIPVEPELN